MHNCFFYKKYSFPLKIMFYNQRRSLQSKLNKRMWELFTFSFFFKQPNYWIHCATKNTVTKLACHLIYLEKKEQTKISKNVLHQLKKCKGKNKSGSIFFCYETFMFQKMTKDGNLFAVARRNSSSSCMSLSLLNTIVNSPCCYMFLCFMLDVVYVFHIKSNASDIFMP